MIVVAKAVTTGGIASFATDLLAEKQGEKGKEGSTLPGNMLLPSFGVFPLKSRRSFRMVELDGGGCF